MQCYANLSSSNGQEQGPEACVGSSQAWYKPKDWCHFQSFESMHWRKKSQHPKYLLMHLNEHFKNVSMSQSLSETSKKNLFTFFFSFQSIYIDIVTEIPMKVCSVFVQLHNSLHWGACSSFLIMIRNLTIVQICALWSLSLKMERSLHLQKSYTLIQ